MIYFQLSVIHCHWLYLIFVPLIVQCCFQWLIIALFDFIVFFQNILLNCYHSISDIFALCDFIYQNWLKFHYWLNFPSFFTYFKHYVIQLYFHLSDEFYFMSVHNLLNLRLFIVPIFIYYFFKFIVLFNCLWLMTVRLWY